jgi:hypothetical protein
MSFSFRSLFQRGTGSSEPEQNAQQYYGGAQSQRMAGPATHSLPSMQASSALQFPAGASPFQMGGGPLFRTAGNEPVAAPPINSSAGMSPFTVAGATPTNAPLTVGDVIQQLPPEVVRGGALPMEQPLSLPPALVENALRSGQAALPVFELYRVCPAMFQVPISPQDPRMVTLPSAKLPGLIAQAREGTPAGQPQPMPGGSAAGGAPSPFSLGTPVPTPNSPAGSPFQMMQPGAAENQAAPLPPPGQAFPASPFAASAAGFTPPVPRPEPLNGSPFSTSQPPPDARGAAPSASPFSMGGAGSPFSTTPATPQPGQDTSAGSPFALGNFLNGAQSGVQAATPPASGAAAGSPFSMGAGAAASPFAALSTPQQPAQGAPAGSPFSLNTPSGASPFAALSAQQPAQGAPAGSPFSLGGSAAASPFGALSVPQPTAEAPAVEKVEQPQVSISQLFTPQSQQQASTPADAAPVLPFGSPFVSAMKDMAPPQSVPQMPAGLSAFASVNAQQPAAAPAPMQFGPSPAATPSAFTPLTLQPAPAAGSSFAPQMAAPASSAPPGPVMGSGSASPPGVIKLGFAAALAGHSMDELGFNPSTLPAWIATQVPAHVLKEQMAAGNFVVELGLLIDGVTDIGFRNTLGSAKRDCRIRLPQNEVFHALTTAAAPAAPAAAQALPAAVLPAARPAATMQVVPAQPQPGAPVVQSLFAQPAAPAPAPLAEPLPGSVLPPFTQSQPQPATAPAISAFASSPQPAAAPAISAFAAPQPAASPPVSAFGTPPLAATATPTLPSFGTPAPASGSPAPFAFPAPAAAFSFPTPAPAEPPQAAPASMSFFGASTPSAAAPEAAAVPPAAAPQSSASGFLGFGAQAPATGPLKPFDPFASSAAGPLPAGKGSLPADVSSSGFSSAQLLGQVPTPQMGSSLFAPAPELKPAATSLFAAVPDAGKPATTSLFAPKPTPESKPATTSLFASPSPALLQPTPSIAPALEEIPSFSPSAAPEAKAATRGLFSSAAASIPLFSEPAPKPAAVPAPADTPAKPAATKHSFLGLAPLDTQTDQLLLRALLATEENLNAQRVVELLAQMPGLSACVCLHGSRMLSYASPSQPEAVQFQQQALEIARQVRGLAPLIGIEGAETFTLNATGRLLTFCFPGDSIVGVLHHEEPTTGMRDKITLIARELARMQG